MVDPQAFRSEHPELCPEDRIRIPGLDPEVSLDAVEVPGPEEAYEKILAENPWVNPPNVRKLMQRHGAEAFGSYISFRLDPARWGVYVQGRPIVGLASEVLRILKLGFLELEERVPEEKAREVAFGMAYDIAVNHLSLHASLDAFAADQEVEDAKAYYAPYQEGPYAESLEDMTGPDGYNWEEVLANLVSLRSFLNPSMTVEFGARVDPYFSDEEKFRWNGFLMSGMLTSEFTYIMRPFPPSHKNFTEFLRRRGEVGPYAHMAIQYDLDTAAFHAGLRRLASVLLQEKEVEEAEKGLLRPVDSRAFLISGE